MRPQGIYMMVIRVWRTIGLIVALSSNVALWAGQPRQEFIGYRAQTNATEVYEMDSNHVTFGGPEILGPRRFQSEFGAMIESCADTQFYCFRTVLRVAVPREGIASSWTAGGHTCQILDSATIPADRIVRIFCRTNAQQSVEFSFSRRRGIVSYRRQCPDCFAGGYVLVTETGLFASPNER